MIMKNLTAKEVIELLMKNPNAEIAFRDANGDISLANNVECRTYDSGTTELIFSWYENNEQTK